MDTRFDNLCNMIKSEMTKKYGKAYEPDYDDLLHSIAQTHYGEIDIYTLIFKKEISKILVNNKYKDDIHPDELFYKIEGNLLNHQVFEYETVQGSTPKDTGLVTEEPLKGSSIYEEEPQVINLAKGNTIRLFPENGRIWG